jgi:hypothetical protein
MIKKIFSITILFSGILIGLNSCKKEAFSFGALKTPSNLGLTTTVLGITGSLPNGDGSGRVNFTASATDVLLYRMDFGDGKTDTSYSGNFSHKYINATKGTYDYTVSVNAIGTGGSTSTVSKKFSVFTDYQIPAAIITALTNNSSKIWITDHDANGHFGVGPNTSFYPDWYAASPNSRDGCAYDDEITFTSDGIGGININVDNKGSSFMIGAATATYGLSGGDGCYPITTIGVKKLAFAPATSGSTAASSTGVQFTVPGNGIINFATGGKTYEIITISDNTIFLRNIGSDGNAWYQKLKVK